jgi:hypothetical protein
MPMESIRTNTVRGRRETDWTPPAGIRPLHAPRGRAQFVDLDDAAALPVAWLLRVPA